MMSNQQSRLYTPPFLWSISLFLMVVFCHTSQAQTTFQSRDNHTGVSHFRSSWDAPWPGMDSNIITDTETIVKGYLIHGFNPAPSNLSLSGPAANLVVEDTLRIHGELRISDGAGIFIKPGGVLIVHGIYEQDGNVTFDNQGQAIFLSDWTAKVSTSSFSNTGNLYIAGKVQQGGLVINHKTYADLNNENPALYYFSRINVIRAACEGTNTGTLTLEGNANNIIRWESSLDFFLNNINQIAHTEGTYTYENLKRTSSFRVYLKGTPGPAYYSGGASIVVLEPANGGNISGSVEELCGGSKSGALNLQDFLGGVVRWETSTDGFENVSSSVVTTDETYSFSNLTNTTSFRAVVKNGDCEEAYSSPFTVQVSQQSQGGEIAGSTEVCKEDNGGELVLSGHTGDIQHWESSASSDFSVPRVITSTSTTLSYENLSQTTYYRAVVKSGVCEAAYSAVATISVSEVRGGTLSGSQTVCDGENEGVLTLEDYQGNILRWEWSTDNFTGNLTQFEHTASQLSFKDLTETTYYRAVTGNAVCGEEYSSVAMITVDPAVAGGTAVASEMVVCVEANSGTVSLEDYAGEIVRWEQSTDGFADDISTIVYSDEVLPFEDLALTTSYRAVLSSGSCGEAYSSVATVTVDQPTEGGTLTGGDGTFCAAENSGSLELKDYFGEIISWERSSDGFENDTELLDHTAVTLSFNDLTATTSYRVLLQNSSCSPVYSSIATIYIDQPAVAGTLQGGGLEVCEGENEGELMLQGFEGEIIRWEASKDHFEGDVQTISHSEAAYAYADLIATTSYRAVLSFGSCGEVFSETATIKVMPRSEGGQLAGSTEVCKEDNGGELVLRGHTGDIQHWESSGSSDFSAPRVIASTSTTLSYENLSQTTYYRAVVKSGVCGAVYSAVATINVSEVKGGTLSGSQTVCEGENEGLLTLEDYQGNILRWESSPDNFELDIQAIDHTASQLSFKDLTETTYYRAVTGNAVCGEEYSSVAMITVDPAVAGGVVTASETLVCAEENSGSLSLQYYAGEVVRWESSSDGFIADITAIAHNNDLVSFDGLVQTTSYRAVLSSGSCGEVYSESVTITVTPRSQGGQIEGSAGVCKDTNSGSVSLTNYTGEIQHWESSASSDFSASRVIASTSTTLSYENLSQTTYYRAVVKSGVCGAAYSAVATISVSEVRGGTLSGSQTVCEGENEGVLTLENYQGNILRWERSSDEFQTQVESIAHTSNTYTYTALAATYSYRVVVGAAGCEQVYSGLATIQVEPVAIGGTITGGKRIIPAENQGELRVEGQQGNIIRWEMSTDNFNSDTQPIEHTEDIYSYENLAQDSWYRVVVGYDNSCAPVYSSSAALLINKAPLVQDDNFVLYTEQAAEGYSSEKSLLENDADPDGDPLLVTSGQDFTTTAGNSLSIDENGFIYYKSAAGFTGIDSLQYRVCDVAGEASRCAYGYVILEISERPVVPDGKVVIYQGVSPNGDGLNDKWVIDHIEQYPDNQVQIFDRSGVLVYETQGYDNINKVFEGYRNKGFGTGSSELPESTYFYRVKLDDTQPLLRGFVILNR